MILEMLSMSPIFLISLVILNYIEQKEDEEVQGH